MHKQLLLFHNAISAYFSGNAQALESTMKQFTIKVTHPNLTKKIFFLIFFYLFQA